MREDLCELLPLTCPACRKQTERGLELSGLAVQVRARVERGAKGEPDELVEGLLRCIGCGRRYPVVDGIPFVFRDGAAALRREVVGLLAQPLSPEVTGVLVEGAGDDEPLPYLVEHLGAYLDTSWGDCAEPPPSGPTAPFGFVALARRLLERQAQRVPRALELGCSVGRGLSCLSRGADLVVGLDRNAAALRTARRLLRGEDVAFARRASGRATTPARIHPGPHAAPRVQLVCGDALDPPFAPTSFDRVAALNLLDNVRSPRALLHELQLLAAPGGEVLLASPYAWRSDIVDNDQRLGGTNPAAALRDELHRLGLRIEDDDERVPWTLRRDARAASLYEVHWVRARR